MAVIGDNVLYRGIKNGKRIRQKIPYKPKFYVKSNKPSKWYTLEGEPVEEISFNSIRDAREFIKQYEGVSNFTIYGNKNYEYSFLSDLFPSEIDWNIENICIAYLDIEVGSENGFPEPSRASEEITAITMKIDGKYHVFGCGEFVTPDSNVIYHKCETEIELIEKFINIWTVYYPDIVSGWNVKFFDFPYLINRINNIAGEELSSKFSPWGKLYSNENTFKGKTQQSYDIMGISLLDYYELYRKYSSNPNQESFKLDHIANVELGDNKMDYSEYDSLHQLYKENFQKFIEYNIKDVEIVERLEDKLKLIELAATLAYDAKVNYDDVFSQVRMWDTITYNSLKKKNIVVPPKKNNQKSESYAGAYVKDPIVGMHEWVASFDLNSLYPHLIMMYNLSPETLVEPETFNDELNKFIKENESKISVESMLNKSIPNDILRKYNFTLTPNAQLFSRDKLGFLSEIMETMYEDRALYKRKSIEAKKTLELIEKELNIRGVLYK